MNEVLDLGKLRTSPNLVTEFRDRAKGLLSDEFSDFDGVLTSSADGYTFFFQYINGELVGALVMAQADARALADRILKLPVEDANVPQEEA